MLKVGLTGGIGSGKSTVTGRLEELGAVVVDADRIAREVVEPGRPALERIRATFGAEVIAADGTLDRPALGRIVFADAAAREKLEAIVHPAVRERTARLVAAAPPDAVVVHDVPLLVEKRMEKDYDLVVVVVASEQTRLKRLVESRGMTAQDASARIRAQARDAERAAVADVTLPNDTDVESLLTRVDALWRERLSR